jgi:glyoxylase-like metal-dependent hydrolase (beta-lactamase superfamily II)
VQDTVATQVRTSQPKSGQDNPPFTREQAHAVGDWVQASNKNLTHIFATHGHGDHWFTAGMLAERFGAQIIATAGTIDQMHPNVAMREAVWDRLFPGQILRNDRRRGASGAQSN